MTNVRADREPTMHVIRYTRSLYESWKKKKKFNIPLSFVIQIKNVCSQISSDKPKMNISINFLLKYPAVVAWIVRALLSSHSVDGKLVDGTFWRSVDQIPLGDENNDGYHE